MCCTINFLHDAVSSITPNPSVIIKNSTTFLVEWSPPFLWPGQAIEYYTISVSDEDNGLLIAQKKVNSAYNDVIVSLDVSIDEHQRQECNPYKFTLSAMNSLNELLQTFNITRGFPSGMLSLLLYKFRVLVFRVKKVLYDKFCVEKFS